MEFCFFSVWILYRTLKTWIISGYTGFDVNRDMSMRVRLSCLVHPTLRLYIRPSLRFDLCLTGSVMLSEDGKLVLLDVSPSVGDPMSSFDRPSGALPTTFEISRFLRDFLTQ